MAGGNNKKITSANVDDEFVSVTLINPNERLVRKETKSVVVRNMDNKLVRRTYNGEELPSVYDVIKEGEIFVREEESRIIVRTEDGKLVARQKPVEIIEEEIIEEDFDAQVEEPEEDTMPEQVEANEEAPKTGDLRSRLMARHSFLGRMERGEKISTPADIPNRPMQEVNSDLVEEIEDDDEGIEEVAVDAEVQELEQAVTEEKYLRDIGKSSAKGVRTNETVGYVSGGAKNPNEKPQMKGTKRAEGLVGNSSLPTPERVIVAEQKPKKVKKAKKERKPVKPWVIVLSLVSIYLVILATYFFTSFNFGKKQVNLVLYYIDVGENAKLEYYDGEKFSSNELQMTYYYSDEKIENFNITESHFAETTLGMGYTIDKGYINALWVDSFENANSRLVKIKFIVDNLICYVPVTIYRNKLQSIEMKFVLSDVNAGQIIYPTVFGNYTNKVLNERQEVIKQELDLSMYDLVLDFGGQQFSLKDEGCFDGTKYIMPDTVMIDEVETEIDYDAPSTRIRAVTKNDGYNTSKSIDLYH